MKTLPIKNYRHQTIEEERLNVITHGLGILFTLVAIPLLLVQAAKSESHYAIPTVWVFGAGMLATYLSSTVYHLVTEPNTKRLWHIIDHICIFLLIGGTYMPLIFRYMPFTDAALFMSVMWGIIAVGIVFKLFFTGRFEWLSLTLYIFLGCMLVFAATPLSKTMPFDVFIWIFGGGVAYLIGVVFYNWRSQRFSHAVWHCFVLMGTVAHYVAVYQCFSG